MNENEKEIGKKEPRENVQNRSSGFNTGNPERRQSNNGYDFQREYKDAFNKALFYEKMAETALAFVDRMNPAKEILPEISSLGDQEKKNITDSLQADMQEWLEMWRGTLAAGKDLPVDIIGMAADIARLDRRRVKGI